MTFIIILESIEYGQNLSITSEILNDYLKDPTTFTASPLKQLTLRSPAIADGFQARWESWYISCLTSFETGKIVNGIVHTRNRKLSLSSAPKIASSDGLVWGSGQSAKK